MRILLVNSVVPSVWGGGEKWFVEAVRWLSEHGHVAHVVARPNSRLLDAATSAGLQATAFDFGGDYDPLATARATALLLRARPDLVLVNFNKEAWLFGRGASVLRRPLVMRHGLTVLKPKLVHRILVKLHARRLIVNATAIREEYERLGFPTSRITVILNGVRSVVPKPRGTLRKRFGIDPQAPLIVGGGRMDQQKRLDRFVQIAASIAEHFHDARFLLLGEGELRDTLAAQIDRLGLRDRVVLTGFVPDLPQTIGDADLFLLTSRAEGTPNVLLEAMAAGTACLAFDVGSVPQILAGELAEGCLPEGDVEAMGKRSIEWLGQPDRLARVAIAQRELVLGGFTQDRSMERYVEVFRTLAPRAR